MKTQTPILLFLKNARPPLCFGALLRLKIKTQKCDLSFRPLSIPPFVYFPFLTSTPFMIKQSSQP